MSEKKFKFDQIKTIKGGKDPQKLIENLILKVGFDPSAVLAESNDQRVRWILPVSEAEELEIILDSYRSLQDATVYLGINICAVPLKRVNETLVTALELADGLVGAKISLVGRYLVLSITMPAYSVNPEDLEYSYRLVLAQKNWFANLLLEELDLESLPVE